MYIKYVIMYENIFKADLKIDWIKVIPKVHRMYNL